MSTPIIIREITAADYPLLEEYLYRAIFLPPGVAPPPFEIVFTPEIFIYIKDFGGKDDCGVVAEIDGEIVGVAWTRIIPAYGHIDNDTPELAISVLPENRNRGVGTMLLMRLFELLRCQGYKRTSLSVQKENPAVRFYKRLGYMVSGERIDHVGYEDYIMVKELSVSFRVWRVADAPDLVMAINNRKVLDNLRDGIPYPYTAQDAVEFITATLNAEKDSQYAFAITYNGQVIGSIGVFRKDNVHRFTAELGYYIAEPYWGKGIMTEAVKQMSAFVFANTDIVRIFAEPYANNTASCRVLEKAGYQFEGVLRKNAIKKGQMMDMRMYALIKASL